MKYIVYVSKAIVVTNHARFTILASDENEAKKKIKEVLDGTCLAERLTYTENEHYKFHKRDCDCGLDQEVDEKKINVYAEGVDEFNEHELKNTEFQCTCRIGNEELLKLSGLSKSEIKEYFKKITEKMEMTPNAN